MRSPQLHFIPLRDYYLKMAIIIVKKYMKSNHIISNWLFTCAFFIICMIIIGGYTRLTDSGLSIVEWKPVTGTIPPLSLDSWNEEFTKYQSSPEYQKSM